MSEHNEIVLDIHHTSVNNMHMIGTKLKHLRVAQGITQAQLAERVGIDRTMISKIEAGEGVNPTIGVLERMATELGASIDVLTADESCA